MTAKDYDDPMNYAKRLAQFELIKQIFIDYALRGEQVTALINGPRVTAFVEYTPNLWTIEKAKKLWGENVRKWESILHMSATDAVDILRAWYGIEEE